MKNFIRSILCLVLLLCLTADMDAGVIIRSAGGGAGGSCSPPTGDELAESFEAGSSNCGDGTNQCDNAWTGSGSPTGPATSPAGASEGENCTDSMRYNSTGTAMFTYIDIGTAIDPDTSNTDIVGYLYIDSHSLSAWDSITLIEASSTTTPGSGYTVSVRMYNNGGTFQMRAQSSSNSSYVDIAVDTWYKITVHLDTTAANSYFQLEGGGSTTCDLVDDCNFTHNGTAWEYYIIGVAEGDDAADVYFAYASVNTP